MPGLGLKSLAEYVFQRKPGHAMNGRPVGAAYGRAVLLYRVSIVWVAFS